MSGGGACAPPPLPHAPPCCSCSNLLVPLPCSEGLYHCDYCHKDLSSTLRIKCVVCKDFDLCLECFRCAVHRCCCRSTAADAADAACCHCCCCRWQAGVYLCGGAMLASCGSHEGWCCLQAQHHKPCPARLPMPQLSIPLPLSHAPPDPLVPASSPPTMQRRRAAECHQPHLRPCLQGGAVAGLPPLPPGLAGELCGCCRQGQRRAGGSRHRAARDPARGSIARLRAATSCPPIHLLTRL